MKILSVQVGETAPGPAKSILLPGGGILGAGFEGFPGKLKAGTSAIVQVRVEPHEADKHFSIVLTLTSQDRGLEGQFFEFCDGMPRDPYFPERPTVHTAIFPLHELWVVRRTGLYRLLVHLSDRLEIALTDYGGEDWADFAVLRVRPGLPEEPMP